MQESLNVLKTAVEIYKDRFDLVIGDAYYFGGPFFQTVLDAGKDVIVKTRKESLELVQLLESAWKIESLEKIRNLDAFTEGFDKNRGCRYQIFGLPDQQYQKLTKKLQCYRIEECYSRGNRSEVYYAFTTCEKLTPWQVRESTKERWQIEDNVFRVGSQNAATKRFHFKDPETARRYLFLLYCLLAVFWAMHVRDKAEKATVSHCEPFKAFLFRIWIEDPGQTDSS